MATPPGPSPVPPSTPSPAAPGPQVPSGSSPPVPAAPPSTPTASPPSTPPPSSPPPSTPPTLPSTPPPTTPPVTPAPPPSTPSPPPSTPSPPPSTPSPPPSTPSPPPTVSTPPPSKPPPLPVPAPPSGGTPRPARSPPTPALPPATPESPPVSTPPPAPRRPPRSPVGSPPPALTTPPSPGETPPAIPPSNSTPTGQPAVPPLPSVASSSPPGSPANPNPGITPPAPPGTPAPPAGPAPRIPVASPDGAAPPGSKPSQNRTGLVVGVGVAVIVLLLVGILVWFTIKKKKRRNTEGHAGAYVAYPGNLQTPIVSSQVTESPQPKSPSAPLIRTSSSSPVAASSPSEGGLGHSRSWFTLEELTEITNGFAPRNLLGEGGFGSVYKGCLSDGREVAVKRLKVGGGQGEREFQAEVEIISRVHHRHLVSLVGYCISDNQRLLVYDYVPNNTLHYHLHGTEKPVLNWATRIKVAVGAARGIAYLHEDCHPRIIHRDIKSSNILLDNSFEARVSDFGLAKLSVDAETHVTTRVMGTFGYLAPEYASSGKLTDRSDVYSFGVVLLELITGRKPVDTSRPLGDESLVEWARPLMTHALETGNLDSLPDVRLQGNYNEMEMFRVVEVAAACVRHSAPMRPRMGLVMRALDNLADSVELHNGVKPGQSELFNAGANSEEIRIFQRMAFGGPDLSSDFSRASWMSQRDSGPG